MSLIVRPGILEIDPYVPGAHHLPGDGPVYKMSSNESAIGASPAAIAAYATAAAEMHRYFDGGATDLRTAIAMDIDADPAQTVATRERMLTEWEEDGILVIGTHFCAPTAGRIGRDNGWRRFFVE